MKNTTKELEAANRWIALDAAAERTKELEAANRWIALGAAAERTK